jgi:hypothetical protein
MDLRFQKRKNPNQTIPYSLCQCFYPDTMKEGDSSTSSRGELESDQSLCEKTKRGQSFILSHLKSKRGRFHYFANLVAQHLFRLINELTEKE